jgi:bacillithiol biosynthesis cysteine-adding enzyme BshC
MKVDKSLLKLLNNLEGELSVQIFGSEIIQLMKDCYQDGKTIEQATFKLVNHLFESFGLVVLLPDSAEVKAAFIPVMKKELLEFFSQKEVQKTVAQYPAEYKIQASGRELNLFYLLDGQRERIEHLNGEWTVLNTELKFNKEQIIEELNQHPERFSPNVILRPVLQELILPNIAFIGGGGEIAYWLQLQKVFEKITVPYPMLVVRNSFLFIPKEIQYLINQLQLTQTDLFTKETGLMNQLVKNESKLQLDLKDEQLELAFFYKKLRSITEAIDITLSNHVASLEIQAAKKISVLEKKMLRAEKKKGREDAQRYEIAWSELEELKDRLGDLGEHISSANVF